MTKEDVLNLMRSSKDKDEWNANCDKVKIAFNGYPDFWYKEVVISGLMDATLGGGSSEIKVVSI